MASLFVSTNFLDLYQPRISTSSPTFYDFFFLCNSESLPRTFKQDHDFGKWKDLPIRNSIKEWVGKIVIQQLFPGEEGFRLALIQSIQESPSMIQSLSLTCSSSDSWSPRKALSSTTKYPNHPPPPVVNLCLISCDVLNHCVIKLDSTALLSLKDRSCAT